MIAKEKVERNKQIIMGNKVRSKRKTVKERVITKVEMMSKK
jgi:hypothetical protein